MLMKCAVTMATGQLFFCALCFGMHKPTKVYQVLYTFVINQYAKVRFSHDTSQIYVGLKMVYIKWVSI